MAIVLITDFTDPPTSSSDYTQLKAKVTALFRQVEGPINRVISGNITEGSIFQIGDAIYQATSDTAITGTPSDYVKITPATSTASAAYVSSLSGVTWNQDYNGYYDVSGNLYIFDEELAIINGTITAEKTKFGRFYKNIANQPLRTTDAVTFATVNTGQGANELYGMDQGVKTTNDVIFNRITASYYNKAVLFKEMVGVETISGIDHPALAAMSQTKIAYIDATLEELRMYEWDDNSWTLLGSALSIAGCGRGALAAMDSTHVAFIDSTLELLSMYVWGGSSWSLDGSALSISGIVSPALAAMDSTHVAFIDETLEELRTYVWSGSAWSLSGSGLSISGIGYPSLCALDSTHVAFIDSTIEELRTYTWSGSAWSQTGSGKVISGIDFTALTTLNSKLVAFNSNSTVTQIHVYYWDGTDWSTAGIGPVMGTIGVPAMTTLDTNTVVFIGDAEEELTIYRVFGVL